MCFLRSLLFAKRLSQPSNSHLNGFSPIAEERGGKGSIKQGRVGRSLSPSHRWTEAQGYISNTCNFLTSTSLKSQNLAWLLCPFRTSDPCSATISECVCVQGEINNFFPLWTVASFIRSPQPWAPLPPRNAPRKRAGVVVFTHAPRCLVSVFIAHCHDILRSHPPQPPPPYFLAILKIIWPGNRM